jgi:hypothetical protein
LATIDPPDTKEMTMTLRVTRGTPLVSRRVKNSDGFAPHTPTPAGSSPPYASSKVADDSPQPPMPSGAGAGGGKGAGGRPNQG